MWHPWALTSHCGQESQPQSDLYCCQDKSLSQDGKVSAYNAGDPGSIPGLGSSPGEGNGNPLQYSYMENPMDGGTWQATVHGVTKSQTRLRDFTSPMMQKLSKASVMNGK